MPFEKGNKEGTDLILSTSQKNGRNPSLYKQLKEHTQVKMVIIS